MATRRRNPRRAKSLRCYTIAEAAELYGVHRNTVRHWLAHGLTPIDNARPTLIDGSVLNAFHKEQAQGSKTKCGPAELYCFRCRAPRKPALSMADYEHTSDQVGTISAICPACGTIMKQKVGLKRLEGFRAEIDVRTTPPNDTIGVHP